MGKFLDVFAQGILAALAWGIFMVVILTSAEPLTPERIATLSVLRVISFTTPLAFALAMIRFFTDASARAWWRLMLTGAGVIAILTFTISLVAPQFGASFGAREICWSALSIAACSLVGLALGLRIDHSLNELED